MRVAYLVNRYPRTSHSFIRREILALEARGVEVARHSLRPLDEPLATAADRREAARTRAVLDAGLLGLAAATVREALLRPRRFAGAARLALRLGWRSDRGLARHGAYLAEACVLAGWLRDGPVDHLHAHFGTNSATVAALCRALGGPPWSFTVHGPDEFDRPEALRLREKARHAEFVVAVSSFGRSQLYRWLDPDDWEKVRVVRCGVDEAFLGAPATPVPAAPRLVHVGRLSEAKGHLVLAEAAARLAAEGLDFEILLAGDGPFRPRIEARVRALGLEGRVRFGGWMSAEQVREAIVSSRALVLPSFAEGLPVVLMEALALGRPVVATAVAGTPELVEPGVSGWIVPAGSAEALAAALREVLRASPERLAEMGRAGAAAVRERHDAATEARALAACFGEAAARSP